MKKKISIEKIINPKDKRKLEESITDKLSSLKNLSDLTDLNVDLVLDLDEQKIEEQMQRNYLSYLTKDRQQAKTDLMGLTENIGVSSKVRKICLVTLAHRYNGILKHDERNDYIARFFQDEDLVFRAYAINLIVGQDMLGTIMGPYEEQLVELKSELVESFYRYLEISGDSDYVTHIPITILKDNRNSSLIDLIEKMKDEVKEAVYQGLNTDKVYVLKLAVDLIKKVYGEDLMKKYLTWKSK
ncbi:MAG: hypothetical protein ACTSQF_08355 [Candidatus Heimdallarchaeaceae archaeon]